MNFDQHQLSYLRLLARQFPTIQAASTEIINLSAYLQLPKGTEHFVSDLHGEYEAFAHVLKNGSGSIKRKIEDIFTNSLIEREKRELATLIYYPEQRLPLIEQKLGADIDEWYRVTLFRLIRLCRAISSKYTRAAVRAALPTGFAAIIEELLHIQEDERNRHAYYRRIIDTVVEIDQAWDFVICLAELVQRLEIARLHVIGDVYDRGPGAHRIMDRLLEYHAVDIQWGNHDIVWMGAAAGSAACMANVIRVNLRYGNIETIENGYAISLLPLASFALETYGSDPCDYFFPRSQGDLDDLDDDAHLVAQMHKAITIIQLKLEGKVIRRRPEFNMADRLLLHCIDYAKGTINIDGQEYPLRDTHFPTIDPQEPYRLTERERNVVDRLKLSFASSDKLQDHGRFLCTHGGMYLTHNGNLLYHGCIPMNDDGSFAAFDYNGREYRAKAFMDWLEQRVRQGFFATDAERRRLGRDIMWYLWCGPVSPIFGKAKMATLERYFIAAKETHVESMNPYYQYRDQEETVERILTAFDLEPAGSHIINGHIPVKVKRGESPVKAGGRLIVIDGGFSKTYQGKTGIAGYTLIYNSYGLLLAAHEAFDSTRMAIREEADIHSRTEILETNRQRLRVGDTDEGREIQKRIDELKYLLDAYRAGLIKEVM